MNIFDVVTYKEAIQEALNQDKKIKCDFEIDLKDLGIFLWDENDMIFCPIKYKDSFVKQG